MRVYTTIVTILISSLKLAISTSKSCEMFNMDASESTPLEVAEVRFYSLSLFLYGFSTRSLQQYFDEKDGHKGIKVFQMNQEYFNYVTMFYAGGSDFPVILNYGFDDPTQVCGYDIVLPFDTSEDNTNRIPIAWSFEAKSNGAWTKLHVFKASEEVDFPKSREFSLDNPGRYQYYRLVITETNNNNAVTANVNFWRVEVRGLITTTMRSKIQQEESAMEKSSVDAETMNENEDWPDRGDDKDADSWPSRNSPSEEEEEVKTKPSALKRDVENMEKDIESTLEYDNGHAAEAILMMGLAMFFVGFIVIRFRQSSGSSRASRRGNGYIETVQRPPDGSFDVHLDRNRAHHGEL
jgi:hypothetical protein